MSSPRPRYALPYVDGPEPAEPAQALWVGSCPRCSGEGVVALELAGADPGDLYTCPRCYGTGLDPDAAELERRRLRDG